MSTSTSLSLTIKLKFTLAAIPTAKVEFFYAAKSS